MGQAPGQGAGQGAAGAVVAARQARAGEGVAVAGMLDIYMSAMSHRLNQEMRVLTVITTIFMPLTLISSIYGMNFKHMPELDWYWGYYGVLGVMALIAAVMGVIFWRRKWI